MTNLPDDLLDPVEARLARRVRGYSDAAVVPIDPVAIAAAASAARPRRLPSFARFGLVAAGAAALVVVASMSIVIIGRPPSAPGASVPAGNATNVPTAGSVAFCNATDLNPRIVRWTGAAGSRIASVELTSSAPADCRLPDYQLALVDKGGRGQLLILNEEIQSGFVLSPHDQAQTWVAVSNYCLAYVPIEPVSIRLDDATAEHGDIVLAPSSDSMSGVPPCNGAPNSGGTITQQDWGVSSVIVD
jgi:hypothetical protein